jgi:hypothetical protein
MPANSAQTFEVMLVPGAEADIATFVDKKLEEW